MVLNAEVFAEEYLLACRLSADFTAEASMPVESSSSSSLESLLQDVVLSRLLLVLRAGIVFRHYIHEIDTVNTFGRSPLLTPHVLSLR